MGRTQRIYCVSHETPLTPDHLFDFAIGLGEYRPSRGAHVSALDTFWDRMRPLAYGAAGNYVIPRAIDLAGTPTELTGVWSHRKVVVRTPIGNPARKFPAYREISVAAARALPAEEFRPRDGFDFLIGMPLEFPHGIVRHYAEMHHAVDLFDYLSLAGQLGVITPAESRAFATDTVFVPGGCELGVYPTLWLHSALEKLELLGRRFLGQWGVRIRTYDAYQVRAIGFLAERLGSCFLLSELRRRYPAGLPQGLFGHLCVIVPNGAGYSGATGGPHLAQTVDTVAR